MYAISQSWQLVGSTVTWLTAAIAPAASVVNRVRLMVVLAFRLTGIAHLSTTTIEFSRLFQRDVFVGGDGQKLSGVWLLLH